MPLNAEVGSTTMAAASEVNLVGAFQPKALVTWGTYNGGNPQIHAFLSAGFADGTSQANVSITSDDGAADSNTNRNYATDKLFQILQGGTAGTVYSSAALSSLDSDGFTLTKGGSGGSADANSKLSYLALGGSDLTGAKIVTVTTPGATGTQTVSGVGFKPDCVIVISHLETATGSAVHANLAMGWATADAQYGINVLSLDAQATTDASRIVSNTALINFYSTAGAVSDRAILTGFTSDGFTLNWTARSAARLYSALCLKFTSPSYVKAGHVTTGTANGQTITASGLGHTPKSVMLLETGQDAFDGVSAHCLAGLGAFDGTRQAMAAVSDKDNNATSVAKSRYYTDRSIVTLDSDGGLMDSMASPSLASGSFSLVATKTGGDTTARLVPYLSFGQPASDDRRSLIAKALSGIALPMKTYLDSRTLDSTLADGPEISLAEVVGGFVHIPTGSSITSLTWYTAPKRTAEGGTYVAAHDENGTAITQTVAASKSYAIPPKLLGAKWAKAVPNADGAVEFTFAKA